jgi:hypothetical protein
MAVLWVQRQDGQDGSEQWAVASLDGFDALRLSEDPDRSVRARRGESASAEGALLLRQEELGEETWVLMAQSARINGLSLDLSMRVLRDKDEISVGGNQRFFYSAERLVCVVPFPGAEHEVFCPRCQQRVEKDTPAVKCPGCGAWHHQSDELPCWTYGGTCTLCDQPTALDAGYRWTPEDL